MNKVQQAKAAVPVILFTFLFCLIIDNGFKTMTGPMAEGLGIDPDTASLQASLAGIIIGIGAVVYAALADAISIRKLILIGLALVIVGSVLGFAFSSSWPIVLTARLIQTCGLAAMETLYVIFVTKHLPEEDQKTYLGFSTASFQASLLVGALTSGLISTYIDWRIMFLVPLVVIVAIPFVLKQVPEEETAGTHLDIVGLALVAAFVTLITVFFQDSNWHLLIYAGLGIVLFALWINFARNPLVRPEFFANGRYVWALVLVVIVYSTQLGYIVMLPFAAQDLHGLNQADAAYLLIPGYTCATLVGIFSGWIGKKLFSRATIFTALGMITFALILGAAAINLSLVVAVISITLFASGFALLYAPLVDTALSTILPEKSGIAIGFYNLTINIGIPLGIAYTFKLMKINLGYSTILWILTAVAAVGTIIYGIADRAMYAREQSAGLDLAANR